MKWSNEITVKTALILWTEKRYITYERLVPILDYGENVQNCSTRKEHNLAPDVTKWNLNY